VIQMFDLSMPLCYFFKLGFKRVMVTSLPSMWRLSNPLKARMVARPAFPVSFLWGLWECIMQVVGPRKQVVGHRPEICQFIPVVWWWGSEKFPQGWTVWWACLIEYGKHSLTVLAGHWPIRICQSQHGHYFNNKLTVSGHADWTLAMRVSSR
jgi:hypothetical protein